VKKKILYKFNSKLLSQTTKIT